MKLSTIISSSLLRSFMCLSITWITFCFFSSITASNYKKLLNSIDFCVTLYLGWIVRVYTILSQPYTPPLWILRPNGSASSLCVRLPGLFPCGTPPLRLGIPYQNHRGRSIGIRAIWHSILLHACNTVQFHKEGRENCERTN